MSLTAGLRWATTRFATSSSSPAHPGQSADHPDFRRSQSLGPGRSPAGSVIDVEWEGPDNPRDYLTIVETGAPEGSHLDYTRTSAARRCRSPPGCAGQLRDSLRHPAVRRTWPVSRSP
ncbi:hypothetical protein DSL92_08740 [Billgrantia gudaonensis]|uniref:Uncharacterized protein n=1 Tax=Billgrantia gudaonensis TaxID=376427 RepID=A0A3S0NDG7_9GAMM|nr:hypothetical protein DSL92_08740 [Halomonas gudaonensis]